MFLNNLQEKEKIAFLELAHYVARSDSDFSSKQKEIIATYCFEMQIDDIQYSESDFNLERNLDKFISNQSKKIALLEIMALIYSDEKIHEEEQKVINTMLKSFKLSHGLSNLYLEWTKTILSVSQQGKLLIEL